MFACREPVRKDSISISEIILISAYSFETLLLLPGLPSGKNTIAFDLCLNILEEIVKTRTKPKAESNEFQF